MKRDDVFVWNSLGSLALVLIVSGAALIITSSGHSLWDYLKIGAGTVLCLSAVAIVTRYLRSL
ncbi:MAG: hypothetical protein ACT4N8_07675 [Sphingosinicella sp.]|uniref:hypothetical protein n=1 Tax=Sphingosinicella sp. TaxID=1917971 RepID=UPI004037B0F3